MAEKLIVDSAKLGNDATTVSSAIKNMREKMKIMKQTAKSLDAMWDGPSSDAFKKAFWDDINSLDSILKKLDKIYKYETNAKKQYESCEKQVTNIVSGL